MLNHLIPLPEGLEIRGDRSKVNIQPEVDIMSPLTTGGDECLDLVIRENTGGLMFLQTQMFYDPTIKQD